MEILSREAGIIYDFNKHHRPIKTVAPGSAIEIETYDCYQNQFVSEDTPLTDIDWNSINPATGPIFVKDAEPGDVLKVEIKKIELADRGVMRVTPNSGVMGHRIPEPKLKVIPIRNGKALFNEIEIPLNPMIGVIGVAPEGDGVNCGTPGPHGGNMDNKMITEGATLYLPVLVEGALFALGDMHAAMGDGEISLTGIEAAGKATVTLDVIKNMKINHPMLENDDVFAQIASAETLDAAVKIAAEEMIDRIVAKSGLSLGEVTMLMSAAGQAEICQVVDPLMTARFVVPKWLLKQMGVELI